MFCEFQFNSVRSIFKSSHKEYVEMVQWVKAAVLGLMIPGSHMVE